jgi:hypothetical protein
LPLLSVRASLESLPLEVLCFIAEQLELCDVLALRATCRAMRRISAALAGRCRPAARRLTRAIHLAPPEVLQWAVSTLDASWRHTTALPRYDKAPVWSLSVVAL